MSLKYLFNFLLFSFIALCTSCKSDAIIDEVISEDKEVNVWSDSIFGQLSEKQQYYQHLIIEVPSYYQSQPDSLVNWISSHEPGALKLVDWNADSISYLKNALDTLTILRPVFYANFFEDLKIQPYEYWASNDDNQSMRLMDVFRKGNFGLVNYRSEKEINLNLNWVDSVRSQLGISGIIENFNDGNLKEDFSRFLSLINGSEQSVEIKFDQLDSANLNGFRKSSGFNGFFISKTPVKKMNAFLASGSDFVIKNIEAADYFPDWNYAADEEFKSSTKRILDFKSSFQKESVSQHLEAERMYSKLNFTHNSVALISNKSDLLPFNKKFTIYTAEKQNISQKVRKESGVSTQQINWDLKKVKDLIKSDKPKVLIVSDTSSEEILTELAKTKAASKTLICFSNLEQYELLKNAPHLCFVPKYENFDLAILAQQFTGRLELNGNFIYKKEVIEGVEIKKTQLGRTIPEYVGYDSDTLKSINWLVNNAMNGRAFPGCQVLLAKDGCIIYDSQYGHHSYKRQKPVNEESIYDLASITKIFATTMVGMKLYEMGGYKLKDSLGDYLPDSLKDYLPYPSTIRNITFEELFIHKSGLPAGFPILKYMLYTTEEIGRYDKYYCDQKDSTFAIEVAENFYLDKEYADSMWLKLNQIWLDKSKPYKYSDVSMNTLYMMFKSIIQNNPKTYGFNESAKKLEGRDLFVEFLYKTYYQPLGMERTCYKPRKKFNKNSIVPTEDESYWRKQLLQGDVHDPNAALMGGIGGNAGLFSTTNDMAILCQMLLNKGEYNGQRYLKPETVTKFTSAQEESSRGLGFNKKNINTTGFGMATESSIATYGHTGFTGTCFWIDPEEGLIYIFLSNRVHPEVNNRIYNYGIRKSIHNTAYEARMFD